MSKKTTKKKKVRKPRTKAVTVHRPAGALQIQPVTENTIEEYIHLENKKFTPQHKSMFVKIATMYQLNPLKKEIYALPFWNKKESRYDLTIIMAYDIFLKRAVRTKKLAGWKVWTTGEKKTANLEAHIEIHRHDWKVPFTYTVSFAEFDKGERLWLKIPKELIKKVCIKSGFGKAFPDELGELPYIAEELSEDMTSPKPEAVEKYEKNITPDDKKPEVVKPTSKRDAILSTLNGSWTALVRKDKVKYNDKYKAKALGFMGCETIADCTDAQLIELTKELDVERRNANG